MKAKNYTLAQADEQSPFNDYLCEQNSQSMIQYENCPMPISSLQSSRQGSSTQINNQSRLSNKLDRLSQDLNRNTGLFTNNCSSGVFHHNSQLQLGNKSVITCTLVNDSSNLLLSSDLMDSQSMIDALPSHLAQSKTEQQLFAPCSKQNLIATNSSSILNIKQAQDDHTARKGEVNPLKPNTQFVLNTQQQQSIIQQRQEHKQKAYGNKNDSTNLRRQTQNRDKDPIHNSYKSQLDKSLELKRQLNGIENEFIEKENLILKQEIQKLQKQMTSQQESSFRQETKKEKHVRNIQNQNNPQQPYQCQQIQTTQEQQADAKDREIMRREFAKFKIQQLKNLNQEVNNQSKRYLQKVNQHNKSQDGGQLNPGHQKQNISQLDEAYPSMQIEQQRKQSKLAVFKPSEVIDKSRERHSMYSNNNQLQININQQASIDSRKTTARNNQQKSHAYFNSDRPSITPRGYQNQEIFSEEKGLKERNRPQEQPFQDVNRAVDGNIVASACDNQPQRSPSFNEDHTHEQYLREKCLLDQIRKLRIRNEELENSLKQSEREKLLLQDRIQEMEAREQKRYDQNLECRLYNLESNIKDVINAQTQNQIHQQAMQLSQFDQSSMQILQTDMKQQQRAGRVFESNEKYPGHTQLRSNQNSFQNNSHVIGLSDRATPLRQPQFNHQDHGQKQHSQEKLFLIQDQLDPANRTYDNQSYQDYQVLVNKPHHRNVFSQVHSPDNNGFFQLQPQILQSYHNTLDRQVDTHESSSKPRNERNSSYLIRNQDSLSREDSLERCSLQFTTMDGAYPNSRKIRDCCKEKMLSQEREMKDKSHYSARSTSGNQLVAKSQNQPSHLISNHQKNQKSMQTSRPVSKISLTRFSTRQNSIIVNNPQAVSINSRNQTPTQGPQEFQNISQIPTPTNAVQHQTQIRNYKGAQMSTGNSKYQFPQSSQRNCNSRQQPSLNQISAIQQSSSNASHTNQTNTLFTLYEGEVSVEDQSISPQACGMAKQQNYEQQDRRYIQNQDLVYETQDSQLKLQMMRVVYFTLDSNPYNLPDGQGYSNILNKQQHYVKKYICMNYFIDQNVYNQLRNPLSKPRSSQPQNTTYQSYQVADQSMNQQSNKQTIKQHQGLKAQQIR